MNGPVADAARLVLFPIGATALGAAGATLGRVNDRISGFVQHFAAGVVFAAVAGEVLPSMRDRHSLKAVLIGFSVGVAGVLALATYERNVVDNEQPAKGSQSPYWR